MGTRIPGQLRTPSLLREQERWMQRQRRKLTVKDRVAIDLRRQDGWGVRVIARELGRSPSVISTEIGREPDGNYAAGPAQAAAAARRDAGPGWQPAVCRGGEAAAPTVVAGADRRETQAHGGWNGGVIRTTSVARGDLRRAAR